MSLATDHSSDIDVSAGGILLGLLLGGLVFAVLEWFGAPRIVAGLAGAVIFVLLAFAP